MFSRSYRFWPATLIAGCPHVSRGETTEELLASVREHARRDHGMTEITEQLRSEILRSVKER